jgi:hypothetical protein
MTEPWQQRLHSIASRDWHDQDKAPASGHRARARSRPPPRSSLQNKFRRAPFPLPAPNAAPQHREREWIYFSGKFSPICAMTGPHLINLALSEEIFTPSPAKSLGAEPSLSKRTVTLQPPGKARLSVPPFQFLTKPPPSDSKPFTRKGFPLTFCTSARLEPIVKPTTFQWLVFAVLCKVRAAHTVHRFIRE